MGTVPGTVRGVILDVTTRPTFPVTSALICSARRTATLGPNREGTGEAIHRPILTSTCLSSLRVSPAVVCRATRDCVSRAVCRATSTASCEARFGASCVRRRKTGTVRLTPENRDTPTERLRRTCPGHRWNERRGSVPIFRLGSPRFRYCARYFCGSSVELSLQALLQK